jgi:hypothetical protein
MIMKYPVLGISRRNARVFWLNLVLLIVSVAMIWFEGAPEVVKTVRITSPFSVLTQIGLFAVSYVTAIILTAIDTIKADLVGAIDAVKADSDIFRQELSKGIVEYQGQSYRSLKYVPMTGAIYYGDVAENNRNILFNNETVKKMLETVESARCGDGPVTMDGKSLLYALGYSASKRFARHFQEHVERKNIHFELASWLHEWTVYDSDAGFGQMEAVSIDETHVRVVIKNSFLTHGARRNAEKPICDFMVGYIEGLLKNFAQVLYDQHGLDRDRITVTHDFKKECYLGHENPNKGCVFSVEVPKKNRVSKEV